MWTWDTYSFSLQLRKKITVMIKIWLTSSIWPNGMVGIWKNNEVGMRQNHKFEEEEVKRRATQPEYFTMCMPFPVYVPACWKTREACRTKAMLLLVQPRSPDRFAPMCSKAHCLFMHTLPTAFAFKATLQHFSSRWREPNQFSSSQKSSV